MPIRRLTLTLIAAVAVTAGASAAQAAAPEIHAHRGGTVLNGKPRYTEESLAACLCYGPPAGASSTRSRSSRAAA
jgi:hypothetical protein